MEMGVWPFIVLGIVAIAAIVVVALTVYSYRRLKVSFDAVRVLPEFQFSLGTVLGALAGMAMRDYAKAAGDVLKGLKVEGKVVFANRSFGPLFLPTTEHKVLVDGVLCPQDVRLPAFWLKPHATRDFSIGIALAKDSLPKVAGAWLSKKGTVEIEIRTCAKFGPFSKTKITHFTPSLRHGGDALGKSAVRAR